MTALPEKLPITAGRVHFIRQVSRAGEITLLNESWFVGRRFAQQYVWATVITHEQRLEIYHRPSLQAAARGIKRFDYRLPEVVRPLGQEFKRPYSRRRVLTML